jgi:membrane fusion protein (multidrug efflux system)
MIAFLTIIYCGIMLLMFKVLKLKPTPYAIAWSIVSGILILGSVIVIWFQAAPMSEKMETSQYVVELVPYVKGQVVAVRAQANQPMKKGDVLLEIDPAPYQYTVNQVSSQLDAAKAGVQQAEANLKAATAGVANAKANLGKVNAAAALAKTEQDIALNIQRANAAAISQLNIARATQTFQEAEAAVLQAQAALEQSQANEQQAVAALQVAKANVPTVQAQLDDAKFNLDQCTMRAPGDGYVVTWAVQPGTMVSSVKLMAAGAFVITSDTALAAVFPQNWLSHVKPGDDVEVVLNPYPGRLFLGKVAALIPATGGGQFSPDGRIPNAAQIGSIGLEAVRINFKDDALAQSLALGSGGSAVIYTDFGKATHIISKVAIRMKKWLLYVIPSVQKPS